MNTSNSTPETAYLARLSRFIDVAYALLFMHLIINFLPHFEDMEWTHKPYGLLTHLVDNRLELLRIFIGAGLALLYWNQNNSLFKNLIRTNGVHAMLSLVQLFLVVQIHSQLTIIHMPKSKMVVVNTIHLVI